MLSHDKVRTLKFIHLNNQSFKKQQNSKHFYQKFFINDNGV